MTVELRIVDKDVNPLELMIVHDDLKSRGIRYASIYKGNDCVWVNYGLVNAYYIFKNSQLVDVQYD
jgi:hypothetical protein